MPATSQSHRRHGREEVPRMPVPAAGLQCAGIGDDPPRIASRTEAMACRHPCRSHRSPSPVRRGARAGARRQAQRQGGRRTRQEAKDRRSQLRVGGDRRRRGLAGRPGAHAVSALALPLLDLDAVDLQTPAAQRARHQARQRSTRWWCWASAATACSSARADPTDQEAAERSSSPPRWRPTG